LSGATVVGPAGGAGGGASGCCISGVGAGCALSWAIAVPPSMSAAVKSAICIEILHDA
jgi:hypothetical protein